MDQIEELLSKNSKSSTIKNFVKNPINCDHI